MTAPASPTPTAPWPMRQAFMGTLTALCAAGLAPDAEAARPFVTDDAGVLLAAECEWETVAGRQRGEGLVARGFSTQLACGVGGGTQLALAHAVSHSAEGANHGWLVSGKTALVDGGEQGTSWTVAWSAAASRRPDGTQGTDGYGALLLATRPLAAGWTAHANLGWLRTPPANGSATTWNLAVEHAIVDGLDVGAEAFGDDHGRPWWGTGVRWALNDRFNLNLGAARRPGADQLSLGVKLVF